MIPESDKNGNLPPGIFEATIEEVEDRFSINFQRKKLFGLLLEVVHWQIDGRNDDAAKGILRILLRSETAL